MDEGDLYGHPELYELAFSYRDVAAEVDALEAWCRAHGRPSPRTALELAAGPAAHAIELSRRGVRVTALDSSSTMCAFARRRVRREGADVAVVEGDMVRFRMRRRFDLVLTMCNSASHILDLDAMGAHLRSVAVHLVPGGIYVMELAHPGEFLDAAAPTQDRWRIRQGKRRVDVRWTSPPTRFDPATQVGEESVTVTVEEDGRRRVLRDRLRLRHWTATEIDAALRLAGGLELAGRYGAFDPAVRFGGGEGEWRMISVVRRA